VFGIEIALIMWSDAVGVKLNVGAWHAVTCAVRQGRASFVTFGACRSRRTAIIPFNLSDLSQMKSGLLMS